MTFQRLCLWVPVVFMGFPVFAQDPGPAPVLNPETDPASPSEPESEPDTESDTENPEAEDSGVGWGLDASVGAKGGYNSNASISTYEVPGTRHPSALSGLSGSVGPYLKLGGLKAALSYELDHSIYFADHSLDQQSHGLLLACRWSNDAVYLRGTYQADVVLLPGDSFAFYALNHKIRLKGEFAVAGPFGLGGRLGFDRWDVRDSDTVTGFQISGRVYPYLEFETVRISLAYEFAHVKLGNEVSESKVKRPIGLVPVEYVTPLSYNGHTASLDVSWSPLDSLDLSTEFHYTHKGYPSIEATAGKKKLEHPRVDDVLAGSISAGWEFIEHLSLEAEASFENSRSNVDLKKITGSYRTFIGTLGITWTL